MLLPFVLAGLLNTAALPPRPPNGTYSYRVIVSGLTYEESTVTISGNAGTITVSDSARIPLKSFSALAVSRYDASTLRQTAYLVTSNSASGKQKMNAAFSSKGVTFVLAARRIDVPADPAAPLEIVSDNLAGTMLMIPAMLHASGATALTLAVTAGAQPIVAAVDANPPEARPSPVPASDHSLALTVASTKLREIYWYDPRTFLVHDVEIPSQDARFELTSSSTVVSAPRSPAPVATPLPTPQPHFTSTDVSFTSADGTRLAGTLTVPDRTRRPLPAVVLVAGSGATNRNEAIGPNWIFLQISNALSNAGFVVLRYDKRGIGKSGGSAAATTRGELVADVRAAFQFALAQKSVDPKRVFLLGHSEGGELVPSVAATDPRVAGLILMAPPALALWKISLEQVLEENPPAKRAEAQREELAALAKIRDGTKTGPGMAWYRSSMDVDPVTAIEKVRAPILILQGGADVQVLPTDLPRLVSAARAHNRSVTVRIFQGDTHLFMKLLPGEEPTIQSEIPDYTAVAQRVDPRVLQAMISWLRKLTPAP